MQIKRFLAALVVPVALASTVTACGSGSSDSSTIKLGVTDGALSYWNVFKESAQKAGLEVETQNFTDYQAPNNALKEGELDVNQYQHLIFLANYNAKNKSDLVPIGATGAYPLPLYSTKHKSVADIPQGGSVVIPSDEVNGARAILVLESAGLVKLKVARNAFVKPSDIDEAASRVKVQTVDAGQTAQALDSVDGAIVNNNYAVNAKLGEDLIIAKDDPASPDAVPYVNAFVVRKADENNENYKKLAAIYHQPEVVEAIKRDLGALQILVTTPAAQLQATTLQLEQTVK